MERKIFLKQGMAALGMAFVAPMTACKKNDTIAGNDENDDTEGTGSGTCVAAPTETEGPYPTKNPSAYVRSDITDGKSGYKMTVNITVGKVSNNCSPLEGAVVDIWHCDAEGNYSEYSSGSVSLHFLRGRQTTDAGGLVTFTTIFPGWYQGRATHIHVHVFNASGTSLKVTQIAFPEGTGSALLAVGGYDKGMNGYTYNAEDDIFKDDTAGVEIAAVTGDTANGFSLVHNINVP